MQNEILCSISTRGRYHTTLPLAIQSVINQTKQVDKLVIFDDNDDPKDLRQDVVYSNLFRIMDLKGIAWEWVYAGKKGQHHNHQIANTMGYKWVWRMDDDTIAEPDVLEILYSHTNDSVGAVGGSILTPSWDVRTRDSATGLISNIDSEPNIQWGYIQGVREVDHLHCSFLYRAGVVDYNTGLSRVAHREETLFTYALVCKGYKVYVAPCITWHLKNPEGGIRSEDNAALYEHDEYIFRNTLNIKDKNVVVLNCGMGDHIVFKRVLKDLKDPIVYTCYPDIIPGRSIAEAESLYGSIEPWNIYRKMDEWNWKGSLEDAFRKMYLK